MPPTSKPGGDSSGNIFSGDPQLDPTATDPTVDPTLTQPDVPVTDDAAAPAVVEDEKTTDLRLVGAFGSGDSFAYHDGEDVLVVGTQPSPVPASLADKIIESARNSGLQIENLSVDDDTSKEG